MELVDDGAIPETGVAGLGDEHATQDAMAMRSVLGGITSEPYTIGLARLTPNGALPSSPLNYAEILP